MSVIILCKLVGDRGQIVTNLNKNNKDNATLFLLLSLGLRPCHTMTSQTTYADL